MPQNKNIILCLLLLTFFSGCASKRAPGGGPIDKTAPEIISTFPTPDSIGIKELSTLKISFSESIDESSIANSVFISPPLEFDLVWDSDVDLEIQLKDSLKSKQTYVIVIGTNVKDLRRNKLAESVQIAFSTGDKIDQGKISGKVYGLKRNETYSLFAFELISDTISFDKSKPDYISQTGEKGKYLLNYLKLGKYRVFAVNDQNSNLIIDSDFERIGVPYLDVYLDSSSNTFSDLNFRTTKIDTTAPRLTTIRSINNRQINLRFSEKISLKDLNQIELTDSISSKPISIFAKSPKIEENNTIELYTAPMDSGRVYIFSTKAFSDSSMNISADTSLTFSAVQYSEIDSFKVITVTPADSIWNAHPGLTFYFEVNSPLDKESIRKNLLVTKQNGDSVAGHFLFPSAYEAEFVPENYLKLDSVYSFQIDYNQIKNVWGDTLADSTLSRHIKINNGDDFGEIAGAVKSENKINSSVYIKAQQIGSKNLFYSTQQKKNRYILNYVPEGTYKLSTFLDSDSNSFYSSGHLYPFQYSEPFFIRSDSIKVRKRWETSDINLNLPLSK